MLARVAEQVQHGDVETTLGARGPVDVEELLHHVRAGHDDHLAGVDVAHGRRHRPQWLLAGRATDGLRAGGLEGGYGGVDPGPAPGEQVAAHLAETGATNGALMALIGRFVACFARGDLAPVADELAWLHSVMPGALTDAVVLGLLGAGREDEARAAWRLRRPVSRDFYWLATTTLRAHAAARLGDLPVGQSRPLSNTELRALETLVRIPAGRGGSGHE